jgi:hypothetical protein
VVVAGVLVLAAGCGTAGPVANGSAGGSPGAGSAGVARRPGVVATPGASRDAVRPAAGAAPVASPTGTAGTADPPLPSGLPSSAPLTVRLGAACVVPGGEQRLVVQTVAEAFVAFDNLYADGRDGQVHGGANGRARSDARGRYVTSWRVAPDAPLGRVRLDVGVAAHGRSAITMRYYRLAARC